MSNKNDLLRRLSHEHADPYSCFADAAPAIMSTPRAGLFNESWIDECAELMKSRFSNQIEYIRELGELGMHGTFKGMEDKSKEELRNKYTHPIQAKKRRGRLAGILARLWRVYSEEQYLTGCKESMFSLIRAMPSLPDNDPAPYASWHPGFQPKVNYELGHIAENITMLIPFIRTELTRDESSELLEFLWKAGDFCFRNSRTDIVFNITFHMLEPLLLIAVGFPEFRDSALWETTAVERLTHLFAGRRGMARGGYFKEGFSYQQVNHNLMMRAYLALKRNGRDVPPRIEEAARSSMEFSSRIIRNDGHVPRVGDGSCSGFWEHDIAHHEFLHLGAAVFNRPDLLARASTPGETSPAELIIWLMGEEGFKNWDSMQSPVLEDKKQTCHDLHYSGFQVIGAGTGGDAHYSLLNYSTNHNHAHHDALSIDITGLGRPLVVDPGTYHYESLGTKECAHSLCRFLRLTRFGPRLEGYDHTGTLYTEYEGTHLKSSGAFHTLYEGHIATRTLTLVLPKGKEQKQDIPAFWVITDTLSRVRPPFPEEDECEIFELIETYFTCNAPGTELGIDPDSLTCWSRYDPSQTDVEIIRSEDLRNSTGEKVNKTETHRIFGFPDSDANIQITGFFPQGETADIHKNDSFICFYGGRAPVPGAGFRWRDRLPHRACYILVPFRGVRDEKFCKVEGELKGDRFTASVHLPGSTVDFEYSQIDGSGGKISMAADDIQETIAIEKKDIYTSRI